MTTNSIATTRPRTITVAGESQTTNLYIDATMIIGITSTPRTPGERIAVGFPGYRPMESREVGKS